MDELPCRVDKPVFKLVDRSEGGWDPVAGVDGEQPLEGVHPERNGLVRSQLLLEPEQQVGAQPWNEPGIGSEDGVVGRSKWVEERLEAGEGRGEECAREQ